MLLLLESISTGELIVIFLLILILFGADKIPGIARGLGKGIRQIKDASQEIQSGIRDTQTQIKREANINREQFNRAKGYVEAPLKEFSKDIKESGKQIVDNVEGKHEESAQSKKNNENLNKSNHSVAYEKNKTEQASIPHNNNNSKPSDRKGIKTKKD